MSLNTNYKAITVIRFEPEYQLLLNVVRSLGYTLPTFAQQIKQNNIVKLLKLYGLWSLLDLFYLFMTNSSKQFALRNWKSPTEFTWSEVGALLFIPNEGFQGNGTVAGYLRLLSFNSSIHAVNFAINSASIGIWVLEAATVGDRLLGNINILIRSVSTKIQSFNSSTLQLSSAISFGGTGYRAANKSASKTMQAIIDNTSSPIVLIGNDALANDLRIFSGSIGGSNAVVSSYYIGASLTLEQHNLMRDILNTYIIDP